MCELQADIGSQDTTCADMVHGPGHQWTALLDIVWLRVRLLHQAAPLAKCGRLVGGSQAAHGGCTGSSQKIENRPAGTWSHSVPGKTRYGECSLYGASVFLQWDPWQEAGLGSSRSLSRALGPPTGLNTRDRDSRASLWTSQHPVLGQEPDLAAGGGGDFFKEISTKSWIKC